MRAIGVFFLLACIFPYFGACELPKIAIIGGGIGGTSCAYFLRSLFGDDLHLDLFEAEEIGGRLSVVEFDRNGYEVGGSIIHSRNKYMTDFLKLFNLTKRSHCRESYFALYNGEEFVFEESQWQIVTLFRLMKRYHFGFWKLRNHINSMLNDFEKIYKYQADGVAFDNVTSLLSAMNPKFAEYLQVNAKTGFRNEGLSDLVIDELVMATLRTNYGQDLHVHKFVGSVSVAGAAGGVWAFDGGNAQVPKKLLGLSGARAIYSPVVGVKKLPSQRMQLVLHPNAGAPAPEEEEEEAYDIVIVATPQTGDMSHRISFENFDKKISFRGRYHQTVCTLIKGTLRESYFCRKKTFIDAVLSISDSVFFNSIGRIYPVNCRGAESEATDVWKIFSQRLLRDVELASLFSDIVEKYVKVWLAYPEYDSSARNDEFVLDENLYHVNAIDWAASSMEMSVIAAKNVALLARRNWLSKRGENCEETAEKGKDEL